MSQLHDVQTSSPATRKAMGDEAVMGTTSEDDVVFADGHLPVTADASAKGSGAALPVAYQGEYARHLTGVRAALGDDAFAATWAAGQALPLEQAIAEVLEAVPALPA